MLQSPFSPREGLSCLLDGFYLEQDMAGWWILRRGSMEEAMERQDLHKAEWFSVWLLSSKRLSLG